MRNSDTDICLSLESMRGRKYLQVRGVVDLPADEVLEGESIDGEASPGAQVQMSIAPTSLLLITYFTNTLCRDKKLSPTGRTRRAIELGLGDDTSSGNTLLVYGQAQEGASSDTSRSIRLVVGRRKPPPSAQPAKVRPGEPLPRAPLFFPSKAPVKAPPPFPNRNALSKSRSFQRAASVNSIYAPPPPVPPIPVPKASLESGSGRTPGRRGEKRKRDVGKEEDRMRRAGKIVPSRLQQMDVVDGITDADDTALFEPLGDNINDNEEEDIFGTKAPMTNGVITADEGSSRKRGKVPQQVLDNKAVSSTHQSVCDLDPFTADVKVIRKQTLVLLESRGYARQHKQFKDIFAMVTKGVYFVCVSLSLLLSSVHC